MRTKKAEIASQKQIAVSTSEVSDEVVVVEDVPKAKEYQVFVRFENRENAENFKFKLKSLGYDNAELSEV
nr:MAG TPA: Regulator of ribonuclease activity B [Bacteriophage sp.]